MQVIIPCFGKALLQKGTILPMGRNYDFLDRKILIFILKEMGFLFMYVIIVGEGIK